MSNSILVIITLYVIFELGMIALSYKLNSLLFTFHTIVFKITFLVPFILSLYLQNKVMVSCAIILYFVSTFFQDIFFKKYHNSKISIPMLFVYIALAIVSIILTVFELYLYTLYLIPVCILLGFLINRNNINMQK
ncbi:MAG: hypothetical protein COZ18_13145 [Flexibacter sp. CG_4_10_14_3_um_filter_32_15]|nr:MAG: hypothetical protein COZ18_13145 [Flexibacter sp. CG_4_10_14_3_um_filter_32_15]